MAKRRGTLSVRRVETVDDRNRSQFLSLSRTGDDFKGYALFVPDPELDDNPGYFEYFDHWDTKGNSYVPCAGDACPFCRASDRPSTRAKTLWLVDDEVKIFTLNWSMINEFADMMSEEEPIQGVLFRIKRLDDRGKYRITPKNDTLTKKALKALLDSDDLPDLEDITTAQLRRSLEDADVADAMEADEDDEDGEDEDKPKARRGKDKDDEPEADADDDLEDENVTVAKVSKKNEQITVEDEDDNSIVIEIGDFDIGDFKKGMEITVSTDYDDDDEEHTLSEWSEQGAEPEEDAEEGGGDNDDLPAKIKDAEMEVTDVNAEDETLTVKNDDYEFVLYFVDEGEASEVDFGDYDEGDTIVVNAVKDDDDDMVATEVPTKPKKKSSGGKKGGKKSTGKKGGKKGGTKKK